MSNRALLIVDVVNDFMHPNGSMYIKGAERILPYINNLYKDFESTNDPIFICKDSHKEKDPEFKLWPKHCVRGTWGAKNYEGLIDNVYNWKQTICKTKYSAFHQTGLEKYLWHYLKIKHPSHKANNEVHVVGVCTDICIFATVLDAYSFGFKTIVHSQGCATFTPNHDLFLKQMELYCKSTIVY